MASQAEVDLVVDTSDTLPELERQLNQIVRIAEDGAPAVDIEAGLELQRTIAALEGQLNEVINSVEGGADNIEVQAEVERSLSLNRINASLNQIIRDVQNGVRDDPIEVQAELDEIASALRLELQVRDVVREVEDSAPEIDIEVDIDRDGRGRAALGRLASGFGGLSRVLGTVAGSMGAVSLATGPVVSLLASTATSLAAIAPASALAVSGLTTLALVGTTTTLAFQGFGDAITAAFDPDAKPEELAEAMERLSPAARAFVVELQSMKDEFKELQQDVQENFFQDLDRALDRLGKTVLPVVGTALRETAGELNAMALGAAEAASRLAEDGTLGKALSSSVKGLENLNKVPGQFVTGLGQIAAAAGPAFERVTAVAADAAANISKRLTAAFESGGLEAAIDDAIDVIAQLGRIAGNVFEGLGNIISTVSVEGNGLFTALEKVTQAFADVTDTTGFQQALKALSQTANVLLDTLLPLISQALQVLGPVFQALAAPVQLLVRALGAGLTKILTALEPVLVSLGNAFGQLVLAVTPLINLAATLIAAILPVLTPLFNALGQALNAITPFIEQLANVLIATLVPVFTKLATEVLPQILPPFIELQTKIFPLLTDILVKLSPSLITLATAFADLLVAVTPVIVELINLALALADELGPTIQPIIDLMTSLTSGALTGLASLITGLIIPTLQILVDLLRGDFRAAWEGAKDLIRNVADEIQEVIRGAAEGIVRNLTSLAQSVGEKALEIARNLVDRLRQGGEDVVADFRSLPDRILRSLGDTGQALVSAGADLVRGFINGIESQIGHLREVAQSVADSVAGSVKDFLGIQSPSKLMMEVGNDTMDGFMMGISDRIPELRRELQGVAALAPSFALPGGQTLKLPQLGPQQPSVQVFIGNEELNTHVDTRISQSNQARDRLVIRGVRP